MKMMVTRKTMISREGATPSGEASGATHILLRISEFASSPRKRIWVIPAKANLDHPRESEFGSSPRKRGSILHPVKDHWIPASAGMTILMVLALAHLVLLKSAAQLPGLHGACLAGITLPATIDSATVAFFAVSPSP